MPTPAPTLDGRAAPGAGVTARRRSAWVAPVGVALAFCLGARLGNALVLPGGVAALWPANAVLVAALLRLPRRRWLVCALAIVPATLLADVGSPFTPAVSVSLALVNAGECLVAALLLGRAFGVRKLELPGALARFVGAALLATTLAGAAGSAVLSAKGFGGSFALGWLQWTLGDLTGLVMLTPAALAVAIALRGPRAWRAHGPRAAEAFAILLAVIATTSAAFALADHGQATHGALALPIPPLLWAAGRLGRRTVALAVAALALTASILTAVGHGAFFPGNALETTWLQGFLAVVALPVLFLGAATSGRERALRAVERARARLEREVQGRTAELAERVKELRQGEQRLGALLRTMASGVVTVDLVGRITYANPAAEEILELRRDVLTGRTYQDRAFRQIDDAGQPLPESRLPIARALADGREVQGAEHGIVRDDGRVTWLSVNAAPLRDAEGAVAGAVASFSDVTARWNAQAEIVRSRDLAELAQRNADAASRSKTDLILRLTHDLRSPLSVVLNYARVLERLDGLTGRQARAPGAIRRAAEQLHVLVDSALDLVRAEAGQMELEPRPCSAAALLAAAVEAAGAGARERQLSVVQRLAAGVPEEWVVDGRRLGQVLHHLTAAALRRCQGGVLELRAEAGSAPGWVRLWVVDAGPAPAPADPAGAPWASPPRASPPEASPPRASPPEASPPEASQPGDGGLGLSIARRLLALLGGELHVQAPPAGRHAFWFEVPVAHDARRVPAAPQARATRAARAGRRRLDGQVLGRVLVVDDTLGNREVLSDTLADAGFEVRVAVSGEEALELLAHGIPPDLVLLDVMMPGLDGFETCRRVRALPAAGGVPVIFMTGLSDPGSKLQGFEAGGVDYVTKPFDARELVARVATHVALRRLERELEERNADLARSRGELRALAARADQVREDEKVSLARDLHDDMAQLLTALKFDLHWIEERAGDQPEVIDRAVSASELADQVLRKVRRVSTELRPVLDHLGLGAALQHEVRLFGERHGLPCSLAVPESLPEISGEAATALYRICQEALTNVVRHAQARAVEVELRAEPGALVLQVRDDGRGLAPRTGAPSGLGLVGMRERAERLGGRFEAAARPGGGTAVTARVPAGPPARA